ncbi:MAG: selenocysteine-specific translation elongation factor [Planctomycetes bacterium RBG_13_44_8b]|nr:MAG: selenocysteine-specific translation elongation factor [Planctomycetes bacterium RBG_13_44_8b]
MSTSQINITLGTAGHIDHGKTALIKLLTGCDTDHLKIEKERGMSIELGFAPCTIADTEIGIVDVPGHENFIKTMVAGAIGIDGVIFVIAADDGVMPQTREHLDILTLLGVKHGIITLTKVDCVTPERLEIVTSEIKEFLAGTFLEDAAILPISNVTGQGFDGFYEALKELVGIIEPKKTSGIFRLPVERAFSLKGYGTVVTGIPVSGLVKVGNEVVLFPYSTKGRVKAIQVYQRDSDTAMVGQCAALNVPQWDYKTIERGNVVTVGDYFSPQQWYLCELDVLEHAKLTLKNGSGVKFHTGTSDSLAALYMLEGNSLAAGQKSLIQVRLSEPIVAGPRDRFIIRSLSPVQTIGGGEIIEAIPNKLKRNHPQVLEDVKVRAKAVLIDEDFVEYCIKTAGDLASNEGEISRRAKIQPERLKEILVGLLNEGKVLELGTKLYIHRDILAELQRRLLNIVGDFHRGKPESPGITAEQFLQASQMPKVVFDGIVSRLLSSGRLIERKHRIALPEHQEAFSEDEQKMLSHVESLYKSRMFNPPTHQEVIEQTGVLQEKVDKILRMLNEQEWLMRVENELFFHANAIEKARQILVDFISKEGKLESVKFKYLLDTTRKFAIPLLDYFDKIGVTRRVGNTRYLKTHN